MKKMTFAFAALAAASAQPALAQDNTPRVTFAAMVGLDSLSGSDGEFSESDENVAYYAALGGDFPVNSSLFVGVEGELGDSELGEEIRDVLVPGDRAELLISTDIAVGARAGFTTGSFRVYGKGGYAWTTLRGTYDDGVESLSEEETVGGWRAGGGVEAGLTDYLALRVEYRYTDYDELEYDGVDLGVDASRNQVMSGLVLAF